MEVLFIVCEATSLSGFIFFGRGRAPGRRHRRRDGLCRHRQRGHRTPRAPRHVLLTLLAFLLVVWRRDGSLPSWPVLLHVVEANRYTGFFLDDHSRLMHVSPAL